MQATSKAKAAAIVRANKLGALADPARNTNEAERASSLAKLIAHCTKHKLNVNDYVKPALAAPDASDEAARAAANRAVTMRHYSGASQASHARRAPALAAALARVAEPIQRAKSTTERDESALALALRHADANNTFCPVAGTFDLGVLSRLASLNHIAVAGDRIALTKSGLSLARTVAKRQAA